MTTPHAPQFIPRELCESLGLDLNTPPEQCLAIVKAAVAGDGISAPPVDVPGLRGVVNDAGKHRINLKIVVIKGNPQIATPLRDIATVVGSDYHDATVLVLSPSFAGSYSTQFPRATLEIGEDAAKTGNPVQSAQNFAHELETPQFPWTAFTIVLLIGVLAAVVGTRIMQIRSRRTTASAGAAEPLPDGPTSAS